MSQLTVFLARLLGLFSILIVAALASRGSAMIEAALANQPVMLIYGTISLAIGLAMVLGHNVWSGGLLPVVVTLVGWLILAKGLLLLVLPLDALTELYRRMNSGQSLYVYTPSLVIGLYLTWAGFAARAR